MAQRIKILAALLLGLTVLTGCSAKSVILHPIEKSDIFRVPKGAKIDGAAVEKDGWFLSDYYVEEIARAKVE